MPVAILYRQELKEYDFGPGHSFRGGRYEVFFRFLRENLSEDDNYRIVPSEPASDEDLLRICQRDYIDFTREYYRAAHLGLSFDGRFYRYHSPDNLPAHGCGRLEEAARLVIGQAKLAADLVQSGQFEKAVSIGGGLHHAKPSYGEGFCIYNDVAFAAAYLMEHYGLEKILILDTDAHAGNGTSEYFYSDPRVLLVDLHQDPRTLYPGTGFVWDLGIDAGKGFTVNIPMPMDAGYDSYRMAFEEIVEPLAEEFKPQIIIRNGGSDPHFDDGLTFLGLPIDGFRMIGQRARKMAEVCQGKVIDLIASGYNEKVLPYAWLALICGLAGLDVATEEPGTVPQRFQKDPSLDDTRRVIAEVRGHLREYWRCL
jgi:acetoin utilization protein AcuC